MPDPECAALRVRKRTRLAAIGGGLSLLGVCLLPAFAHAAPRGDACSWAGGRARELCETAAHAGRDVQTVQDNRPAPGYGSTRSASIAPPPVRPGFTRLNVVGNLYVDVQGDYPEGYTGRWTGVNAPTAIPVSQTWYVNNGEARSSIQQPATLATPDGSGPAQFGFVVRGKACYGDITGTDGPVLLTEAPMTFRVSDLHTVAPIRTSGCVVTNTLNNFAATVTLSADSRGDVNMQYDIEVYSVQGMHNFHWESADYQLKNTLTPELAAADLTRKRRAAADQAAADQAAAAQAAQDEADRQRSDDILNSLPPVRGKK